MKKLNVFIFWGSLVLLGLRSLHAAQINTYGKLVISSDDYTFSARVTGRLHLDGNFYRSDSENRKLTSGTFVRRARIGVEGNFHEYEYEVECDFATDQATLKSAKLRRQFGPGKATIGQFKVFEGLERVASSNDLILIERPYLSDILPGFKIGLGYNGTIKKFGFSGNVYNLREAADGEDRPTNSGAGVVGRAFMAPINQKTLAVHVGASFAHESTDVEGMRVRVSPIGRAEEYKSVNGEEPEDFRFVIFDRRGERAEINRLVFEGAAINGPLMLQAEFLKGDADTKTMSVDKFQTWYIQGAYVLTGEAREYAFRRGRIKRPVPNHEAGAVELAARYQQAERTKVTNAKLTSTEFGVTYYANANIRFLANYGWADNKLINDKPRLFSTRVQFDF